MVLSSECALMYEWVADMVVVEVRVYERRRELISKDWIGYLGGYECALEHRGGVCLLHMLLRS